MSGILVATQLFNGLSLASIYLLAALGLALSFGLMRSSTWPTANC
jgi:urea transport system permease protein